jgi:serine/threonine protein kinase
MTIQRSSMEKSPDVLLGKYEVVRTIYDEPMSLLQLVNHRLTGDSFLLKTIRDKSSYHPDVIEAVKQAYSGTTVETRVALPLEILEDANSYYELLPRFDGWTVYDLVNSNSTGVYGALLETWTQDLLGLIAPLHNANVKLLHRDINPYNVLVTSDHLRLVLLDFSSAVALEPGRTYTPIACPGFTAPEQRRGEYGPRCDVYSAGALLLYLNTGEWPPTIEQRVYQGQSIELLEGMRLRLRRAIYRMLSLDPSDRFEDAKAALSDLSLRRTTEMISLEPLGILDIPDGSRLIMSRHSWDRLWPENNSVMEDPAKKTEASSPSHSLLEKSAKSPTRLGHLQVKMMELKDNYDTLTTRIAALDKEIGLAIDPVARQIMEERRANFYAKREEIVIEMTEIESNLLDAYVSDISR